MKTGLKILCLVLWIGAAWVALADGTTAHLTITPPNAYTDNSPLMITDIAKHSITWTGRVNGSLDLLMPNLQVDIPNLICSSVVFSVQTVMKDNSPSDPFVLPPYNTGVTCSNKPNPPRAVTIK